MLTINVNGKRGVYELSLPTSIDEITIDYIKDVTSHVKVDANYSLIGVVYRERLSTLILAASRNKKKSDVAVIPIFVKSGETESEFINSLNVRDKLIISPSEIMTGYHISAPNNLLTINNILELLEGDSESYKNIINVKDNCYFIEFKLVPNCNIHGAYVDDKDIKNKTTNPYVNKISDSTAIDLITVITPKVIV